MEHEDNYNNMQNAQNLMENVQIASGGGVGGVCGEIGEIGGLVVGGEEKVGIANSGKFEHHVQHDDDDEEWKYIKEVQQSEKQQQHQQQLPWSSADNGRETETAQAPAPAADVAAAAAAAEVGNGTGNGYNFGYGNNFGCADNDADATDFMLGQHAPNEFGNGHTDVAAYNVAVGGGELGEIGALGSGMGLMKNDGDFSAASNASNATSTPAEGDVEMEEEGAESIDLLQVHMKIEPQQHQQQQQQQSQPDTEGDGEEDELSSLATTNGTSSLSENPLNQVLQQQEMEEQQALEQHEQQQQQQRQQYETIEHDDVMAEGKENRSPLPRDSCEESGRPENLDFELHSQLNPDAKEFVPSFNSPTMTVESMAFGTGTGTGTGIHSHSQSNDADIDKESEHDHELEKASANENEFEIETDNGVGLAVDHVGEPAVGTAGSNEPHPNALPRHVWATGVDDFVAQSPCKGRDVDMGEITVPAEDDFEHEAATRPHQLEQEDDLIADVSLQANSNLTNGGDSADLKAISPASFIDHGPETCVDLDADLDLMEETSNNANNAHGVTTEAVNGNETAKRLDFGESEPIEDILNSVQPLPTDGDDAEEDGIKFNDKELLSVEEKENISHSPSTEEMQMNFYESSASTKDVPQIPMDDMTVMDMNNAAHMEGSFYVEHTSSSLTGGDEAVMPVVSGKESAAARDLFVDDSLLVNTSNPLDSTAALLDATIEPMRDNQPEIELPLANEEPSKLPDVVSEIERASPSPLSTEEKHLMEETKEDRAIVATSQMHELEQQMDDLRLSSADGALPELAEESAPLATTIEEAAKKSFFDEHVGDTPKVTADLQSEAAPLSTPTPEPPHYMHNEFEAFSNNDEQYVYKSDEPTMQLHEPLAPSAPEQVLREEKAEPEPESRMEREPEVEQPEAAVEAVEQATVPVAEAPSVPMAAPAETASAPTADEVGVAAVAGAATAVAAATAVVAATAGKATASSPAKKSGTEAAKKPLAGAKTAPAAKPKVGEAKKPLEPKKAGPAASASARPRTAPAASATSTTARKPLAATGAAATATKSAVPAKSASSISARAPLAASSSVASTKPRPTSAAAKPMRPLSATSSATSTSTARKSAPSGSASASTITASSTRGRPSSGAAAPPSKPNTLGLSSSTSAKPKLLSPRANLTSQLRKAAPGVGAKSPTKPAASSSATTTNITGSSSTTTTGNRLKTSTSTTTTTTKTFTARPAPKTTASSSGLITARRAASTTATNAATPGTSLRKSSPTKPTSIGATKTAPLKTIGSATKTKDTAKSSAGSGPKAIAKQSPVSHKIRKPEPQGQQGGVKEAAKVNGGEIGEGQAPQLNGDILKGGHNLQNGQLSPNQTEPQEQPLPQTSELEAQLIDA